MGDASGNSKQQQTTDFFGQRNSKRSRTQEENFVTPKNSNLTITSDEDTSRSVSTTSIPAIRLNNDELQGNSSVDTVVTPSQMDKEKEKLVFKLDKLNDSWWTVTLKGSHYGDRKSTGTPKAILDTGTSFLAIA